MYSTIEILLFCACRLQVATRKSGTTEACHNGEACCTVSAMNVSCGLLQPMVNDSQGKYTHFLTITCYPKFPPGSIDVWSNNETRLVVIKDISEIKHLSLFLSGSSGICYMIWPTIGTNKLSNIWCPKTEAIFVGWTRFSGTDGDIFLASLGLETTSRWHRPKLAIITNENWEVAYKRIEPGHWATTLWYYWVYNPPKSVHKLGKHNAINPAKLAVLCRQFTSAKMGSELEKGW